MRARERSQASRSTHAQMFVEKVDERELSKRDAIAKNLQLILTRSTPEEEAVQ